MIRLADYVIDFFAKKGVKDLFMVSGGGIMYLQDAVGRNTDIRYICNYHEQACAIAAEAYARVTNHLGVCLVTTGPASMNALAGMVGSWINSVPIIVLSGQVRTGLIADYSKIRQKGPQEINIVDVASPITKYAVTVMDPQRIRYELEKAYFMATSGRPGPAWIDLPLDIQGAMIDEDSLQGYEPEPLPGLLSGDALTSAATQVAEAIKQSKRPLFVVGNGIHISHSISLLKELMERTQIPAVFPYTAPDVLDEDHPLNMGVFGTNGQRRANFTIQNTDCLISLGSGLCITKTGFNFAGFAPKAKVKIFVDIDAGQLYNQVLTPDIGVQADLNDFLTEILHHIQPGEYQSSAKWTLACQNWRERYPIITPDYYEAKGFVNSYVFVDKLAPLLTSEDVLIPGNGLDSVTMYQAFRYKEGQRFLMNGNWGSMGWDLPLAVGGSAACKGRAVLVTGDGSLAWNIQELITIMHNKLAVKIFMFNNGGYSSIRATQNNFFEGRRVGADSTSGVGAPNYELLSAAFGIPYFEIHTNEELDTLLPQVLNHEGACFCNLFVDPIQFISPRASSFRRDDGTLESRPLEDMAPFLPREEVWENMHQFDDSEV